MFFFSCSTENTSEIVVSVSLPTEDSGDYLYQPGDIVRWRAELINTETTRATFLPTGKNNTITQANIAEQGLGTGNVWHGKYVIWAYGYDKAGTQIAFSGGADNTQFLVDVDYDETKWVTVPFQWCAAGGERLKKHVRFWDTDADELIGTSVNVAYGTTFDSAKIPTKENCSLECYKDSACTVPFDFSVPITYSVTVWCKWIAHVYDADMGITVTIDTTTSDLVLAYAWSGTTLTFTVADASGKVAWYVNGTRQMETGATLTLETAGLDAGTYEIEATAGTRGATAKVKVE